ncbi:MAG: VOC family protein, partial [Rickettsiales bacterium]|nr:VOC family protein [Rickettsiales bacterium]
MGFAEGQVSQSAIRAEFAHQMSLMYSKEVPLYQTLVDIVSEINAEELKHRNESDSVERISAERHGAIRLATYDELKIIARLFGVMGMYAVGYYDLSVKNLPVHSTAFRPIDRDELAQNPFRMFCSVLRLDLLDENVAQIAKRYLGARTIFSDRLLELINCYESEGFDASLAEEFVSEAVKVFKWHDEAVVSKKEYQELLSVNGLIADIIGFKGPHINHLTPRVLDIDHLHSRMQSLGHTMIPNIQGPPRRKHDILLRQTSFQALNEQTRFPDGKEGYEEGHH